jgi:hypothetical protein
MTLNNHKAFMFDICSFCGDIDPLFQPSFRKGTGSAPVFMAVLPDPGMRHLQSAIPKMRDQGKITI